MREALSPHGGRLPFDWWPLRPPIKRAGTLHGLKGFGSPFGDPNPFNPSASAAQKIFRGFRVMLMFGGAERVNWVIKLLCPEQSFDLREKSIIPTIDSPFEESFLCFPRFTEYRLRIY